MQASQATLSHLLVFERMACPDYCFWRCDEYLVCPRLVVFPSTTKQSPSAPSAQGTGSGLSKLGHCNITHNIVMCTTVVLSHLLTRWRRAIPTRPGRSGSSALVHTRLHCLRLFCRTSMPMDIIGAKAWQTLYMLFCEEHFVFL